MTRLHRVAELPVGLRERPDLRREELVDALVQAVFARFKSSGHLAAPTAEIDDSLPGRWRLSTEQNPLGKHVQRAARQLGRQVDEPTTWRQALRALVSDADGDSRPEIDLDTLRLSGLLVERVELLDLDDGSAASARRLAEIQAALPRERSAANALAAQTVLRPGVVLAGARDAPALQHFDVAVVLDDQARVPLAYGRRPDAGGQDRTDLVSAGADGSLMLNDRPLASAADRRRATELLASYFAPEAYAALAPAARLGLLRAASALVDQALASRDPQQALGAFRVLNRSLSATPAPQLSAPEASAALALAIRAASAASYSPDFSRNERDDLVVIASLFADQASVERELLDHLLMMAPASFRYLTPAARADRGLIARAARALPETLAYANPSAFHGDLGWLRALVKQQSAVFALLPEALRDDKALVLSAVRDAGPLLEYASARLRDDLEVATAAIERTGLA